MVIIGVVAVVAGVWLLTWDIHVEGGVDDRGSCGSAYDVVLLRGNGDLGGEPVSDQAGIDRACVREAGRYVVGGTALGVAGVVLAGVGLVGYVRRG